MTEEKKGDENLREKAESGATTESQAVPPPPAWEADLDSYPLRAPSEDPRWAVRTVWCWVVFAVTSLVFILVLLVLGAFYD
jgi:hypothetical protein